MSFAFGFRIDDTEQPVRRSGEFITHKAGDFHAKEVLPAQTKLSPQPSPPTSPLLPLTLDSQVQNEAVRGGSPGSVEESLTYQRGSKLPFTWITPSELEEIWSRKRREGLSCNVVALEPPSCGSQTLPQGSSSSSLPPSHTCGCDRGTEDGERVRAPSNRRTTNLPLRYVLLQEEPESGRSKGDVHIHHRGWELGDVHEESVIQRGVYEGGGVVWECSVDLISYLMDNSSEGDFSGHVVSSTDPHQFRQQQHSHPFVLELGCGHALPTCYLLQQALMRSLARVDGSMRRHDATTSHYSTTPQARLDITLVLVDYNRSVVESKTVPNLILNASGVLLCDEDAYADFAAARAVDVEAMLRENIVLGAGDWMEMSKELQTRRREKSSFTERSPSSLPPPRLPADGNFHLILAAETLYTQEAARETAELVMRHLHPTQGVAYVASKRYYFGAGGGVDDFRSALDVTQFRVETVRVVDTGVGNIREILKVTRLSFAGDASANDHRTG